MRPLTAAEWLEQNATTDSLTQNMEQYARYYASFVPDDVEVAIEQKYPHLERQEGLTYSSYKLHNDHADLLRTAARYGASLAGRMEAVRFADWSMNNNYVPDVIEKKYWLSDFDAPNGVEPFTTEQLYSIFKNDTNGK